MLMSLIYLLGNIIMLMISINKYYICVEEESRCGKVLMMGENR